jgi:hypothetical protein
MWAGVTFSSDLLALGGGGKPVGLKSPHQIGHVFANPCGGHKFQIFDADPPFGR